MNSPKKPIRKLRPQRTCTRVYASYRKFKRYLQVDFNSRCGYCDDPDLWVGGYKHYHIDHFVPKIHLKTIKENDYRNLVYACLSCNNSKGEDWPSGNENRSVFQNQGYIDPCDARYDQQFHRVKLGDIVPKTKIGHYMFEKMKLGLRRHAVIWILDRLDQQIKFLSEINNNSTLPIKHKRKINILVQKLYKYYYEYIGVLHDENNN